MAKDPSNPKLFPGIAHELLPPDIKTGIAHLVYIDLARPQMTAASMRAAHIEGWDMIGTLRLRRSGRAVHVLRPRRGAQNPVRLEFAHHRVIDRLGLVRSVGLTTLAVAFDTTVQAIARSNSTFDPAMEDRAIRTERAEFGSNIAYIEQFANPADKAIFGRIVPGNNPGMPLTKQFNQLPRLAAQPGMPEALDPLTMFGLGYYLDSTEGRTTLSIEAYTGGLTLLAMLEPPRPQP